MLVVGSALKGYTIEAKDGRIGTVRDFLFDDRNWKIRWLVVDTGEWLSGRRVLIHPSAIGQPLYEHEEVPVALTKLQVEESPSIAHDLPVSRQMETSLLGYYGFSGAGYISAGGLMAPLVLPPLWAATQLPDGSAVEANVHDGDPHLRSIAAVRGYHLHGEDGPIGHVENLLIEDTNWEIRFFIVDTRNWLPGKHVLLSPYAVREINWPQKEIWLNVSRDKVEASPPWEPMHMIDEVYQKRIHSHYGWPGYR